jgi:hypothetical protein
MTAYNYQFRIVDKNGESIASYFTNATPPRIGEQMMLRYVPEIPPITKPLTVLNVAHLPERFDIGYDEPESNATLIIITVQPIE